MGSNNSKSTVNHFETIPDKFVLSILEILCSSSLRGIFRFRLVCKRFEKVAFDCNLHNSSISELGYWMTERTLREKQCPYAASLGLKFLGLSARIVHDINKHSEMFRFSLEIYPSQNTQASEQYFLQSFKTRPTSDDNSILINAVLACSLISRDSIRYLSSPAKITSPPSPPPPCIPENFGNLKILGLHQLMLDQNLMESLRETDLDSLYLSECSPPDDSYHFLDDLEKFDSLKLLYFSCIPNKSRLLRLPPNLEKLYVYFDGETSTPQAYVIEATNCKSLTHL